MKALLFAVAQPLRLASFFLSTLRVLAGGSAQKKSVEVAAVWNVERAL